MSNTNDKYIIVTFSTVNNLYLCHPYIFITDNYSSKFAILFLCAPAPKSPTENDIPQKSLDTSLTIFEKKLFKVSAVSASKVSVFSFSVRFIFSLNTVLPESKGFTVFQNFLSSITFLSSNSSNFGNTLFFSHFQESHFPLFYI